jgi:hypothetical protein
MKEEKVNESDQLLNFAEGYAACVEAAFQAKYDEDSCPCEEGSIEEKCWHRGWKKAREILS